MGLSFVPAEPGLGLVIGSDGVSFDVTPAAASQALGWFNVKSYGAVGDGSTDDTTAISNAIVDIVSAGFGVLYFPAGTYKTSGGFTLSVPTAVVGDGADMAYTAGNALSRVLCTSSTAVLFTVTSGGCGFRNIMLDNTSGSTPTAGAAISVTAGGSNSHYENLMVRGFYINLDIQTGGIPKFNGCLSINPVKYGLKLRNTASTDWGDQSLSGLDIISGPLTGAGSAALRYESGGGAKLSNAKINNTAPTDSFVNGIELAVPASVSTAILLVSNSSIENVSGDCIHITTSATKPSSWPYLIFNGLELTPLNTNTTGHSINIVCDALGDIKDVVIGDCVMVANPSNTGAAVNLVNVNNVYLSNNIYDGFGSLVAQSGCTNVVTGGAGTVTSVALTMPAEFSVSGSPVTGSGTLAVTKANESANQVFAGPTSGSPAAPAFRSLVGEDVPVDNATVDVNGSHQVEVKNGGIGAAQLANTAVTPGTYGDSTHVAQVTVDQQGRITAASSIGLSAIPTVIYQPLTDGSVPALVFAAGDVVMVPS